MGASVTPSPGQQDQGSAGGRTAVFVDRDGTLMAERDYICSPEEVALIPGAASGVARLREAGHPVVVISNQSGVGRGYFGAREVESVNARLSELLHAEGTGVDGIYYCPHAPSGEGGDPTCRCRKPRPGLVERAVRDMALNLGGSLVVGDSLCDLELGWGLGLPVVLVLTGYGKATWHRLGGKATGPRPDHVASDLGTAVPWILRRMNAGNELLRGGRLRGDP